MIHSWFATMGALVQVSASVVSVGVLTIGLQGGGSMVLAGLNKDSWR